MVLVVACGLITAFQPPEPASAAVASDFNPGNIISDATFYDSGTMSVGQIQTFLNSKVPNCKAGYTCLKDYSQATTSQPSQAAGCSPLSGQNNLSAAAIIYWVSIACGINPQVLIVLLEKEQSLVSATSPGAGSYRSATGFACPDTAQCDARYYGYFNQVYNAALQFKRYQYYPTYFNHRAGRVNNVQWHPTAACGSAPLYIENQATAGLYNYTPYRPNDAALNNLYGTGDGCSAYGNRNFWRMFTDWFGSAQNGGYFLRTDSNPDLYLVSGTTKYRVPSMEVFNTLSALGPYRVVSSAYLNGYATASKPASTTIRNPLNGDVYGVENGQKHRFSSCELLVAYGSSCGAAIDLTSEQLGRIGTGADVSAYFLVAGSPTVYWLSGNVRHPIHSWDAVLTLNGGAVPYLTSISASAASKLALGKTLLEPLSLVKSAGDARVFIVDGLDRLIPVPSFAIPAEIGKSRYAVVPDAIFAGYQRGTQDLSLAVRCDNAVFMMSQGTLRAAPSAATAGIPVADVSSDFCSRVPQGARADGPAVFIQPAGSPNVYVLRGGKASKIESWTAAIAINGGATPQVIAISAANVASMPSGPSILSPASLVRTADNPTVFLIDGFDKRVPVGSFVTTAELGIENWSQTDAASMSGYVQAGESLSRQLICGGTAYFAAGGRLYPLSAPGVTGLRSTMVADLTCAQLTLADSGPLSSVFVKAAESATVYHVIGGTKRAVTSWEQLLSLNGGSAPSILTAGPQGLADIANGRPY
ncbi:hypothetical protein [Mycetocola zhadangensis]|nr:hypothetical protein [Mycetocola zhadangensis]